jgi:mono/diheme cytochrome c family protein
MRRWTRGLAFLAGGIVALIVVALVVLFVWSEIILRRTYDVPLETFVAPSDSASIAAGERQAILRGCYSGCHGTQLEGGVFFDEPGVARVTAPDLTRVMYTHSDAELERVIRHGVRRNGRSVFAMPSSGFSEMTDEDLADIIAFVRSRPRGDGAETGLEAGPLGRLGIVLGQFPPIATEIEHTGGHGQGPDGPSGPGRYLARTICSECHGLELQGFPEDSIPPLAVAKTYSLEQFTTLLRTGVPVGGRTLGLMAEVARSRFYAFTDEEILQIYNYLGSYGLESRTNASH